MKRLVHLLNFVCPLRWASCTSWQFWAE